jgi:hypothetical protein
VEKETSKWGKFLGHYYYDVGLNWYVLMPDTPFWQTRSLNMRTGTNKKSCTFVIYEN